MRSGLWKTYQKRVRIWSWIKKAFATLPNPILEKVNTRKELAEIAELQK